MKKTLITLLIILFVIGGGGAYAYTTFAYSDEEPVLKSEIMETKGSVLIQSADSTDWKQLFVGDEVHTGDMIKTGSDSFVVLSFFDNSTSRLDENTEISLDTLFYNTDRSYEQRIGIGVVKGTVWSRVLRLIDKDSDFSIQTPTAVATVRGTALDVSVDEEGKTDVQVADNVVEVQAVKTIIEKDSVTGKRKLKITERMAKVSVPEDNQVSFDPKELPIVSQNIIIEKISDEVKKTDWFQQNQNRDGEFEQQMKEKEMKRLQEKEKILPDSALYGIKKAVEKLDISLTGDDEKKLEKELDFARRRFDEALLLEQKGDSETSKSLMVQYETTMKEKISGALSLDQNQRGFVGEKIDEFVKRNEKAIFALDSSKTKDYVAAIDSVQDDFIQKNPMNLNERELKMREMDQLKRKYIDIKGKNADSKEYYDLEQKRINLEKDINKMQKDKNGDDDLSRSLERINLYRGIGVKEIQGVKDLLKQIPLSEDQKTTIINQMNDGLKTLNSLPIPEKNLIDPKTLNLLGQTPVIPTDPQKIQAPILPQPIPTQPLPTTPIETNQFGLTPEQYRKFIESLVKVGKLEVFKSESFEKQKLWVEYFKDGFSDFSIMR